MKKIFESKKNLLIGIILIAVLAIGFNLWSGRNGRFVRTGDMNFPRMNHAATLLQDSRVLITGWYAKTAEIYNPKTQKFTRIPDMVECREAHTSTLLRDGRVLITGGKIPFRNSYHANAEIYNPKTNTFTKIENMHIARIGHSALLLNNGKVLVIGGYLDLDSSKTSSIKPFKLNPELAKYRYYGELYDPKTNKFTLTPKHKGWYVYPTLALLPDGKVLIVGDYSGKVAEIYNPNENKFVQTGNTTKSFYETTSVLLNNNKVLIAGSAQDNYSDLYDIKTGTFQFSQGKLNTIYYNAARATATLLNNGNVLIIGTDTSKETENLYNSQKDIFIKTSKMINAVSKHTATKLNNGNVLITGGIGKLKNNKKKSKTFKKAELYKY